MNPGQSRKALLVAGMHRSGTSALTRVLNLLGVEIGDHLLPPRADNPSGYWEDESVVACNDELLREFGLSWRDPWPLPDGWLDWPSTTDWCGRLRRLLEDRFADTPLFMAKDPRISRLLPAWERVLEEMQVLPHVFVCIRHPIEVAESLRMRTRMPRESAQPLWLTYTVEAERDSRRMARQFVRYDQLLEDWPGTAQRIQDQFELAWPRTGNKTAEQIDAFLDPGLRHHNARAAGDGDASVIGQLATRAYALALRAAEGEVALAEWEQVAAAMVAPLQELRQAQPPSDTQPEPASRVGAPERQVVDLWTPMELKTELLESRLYFRQRDTEALESAHVSAVARTRDHPMHVAFELPDGAPAEFVRFDPASMPGIYRLHGIRIDGHELLVRDLRISAVRERQLASRHGELLRFYCSDEDPYVELDIRELHRSEVALRMEFLFDCDSPLEELDRRLDNAQQQMTRQLSNMAAKLVTAEKSQSELGSRLRTLEKHMLALARRVSAQSRFDLLVANRGTLGPRQAAISRPSMLRATTLPIVNALELRLQARNPEAGGDWWSSDGGDPAMVLGAPPRGFVPGWYVLAMNFAQLDDQKTSVPSLYVDHGDGFDEAGRIELAISHHTSRQRLLLHFDRPIRRLRFDPRNGPGEFLVSPLRLRRVSRLEALARLAVPAMQRMRDQGATWSRITREMLASLRTGPDKALTTLHINTRIAVGSYGGKISYADWIARYDKLTDDERQALQQRVKAMRNPPLISIVVPVYDTPAELLRQCIESVQAQIYPHWELCIANDASPKAHVRTLLDRYVDCDPRIKVVHRETNGHISAASNSAVELASGDWTALLDHDDLLPVHALLHVAETIATNPSAQLIYSDEDKLDSQGNRYDPYFKPDWNPELFLCQNFVSHLGVYRTDLIKRVGGFREGFEGSQDHDLALRCIERIDAADIVHIPKVLYHWRAIAGSTAKATNEKTYAADAGLAAVAEHLERQGSDNAQVTRSIGGYYRVRYPIPTPPPRVTLIIPTRDRVDLLRMSVGSILKNTRYPDFEVIIVDNQSEKPETLAWFEEIMSRDQRVKILRHDEPFNFSRINNVAVAAARGEIVGLVNNDIEVTHADWLAEMVSHAARDGVGAVGAKLYYPDGSIQHAGVVLGYGGVAAHAYAGKPHDHIGQMGRAMLVQNMSAVTAACMLVKKSTWIEVGGMNEELEVAFNDIDFCLRLLRAGYRNVWTPHAELVHHESASRGYEDTADKKARFDAEVMRMQTIWGKRLASDPAHHPDLILCGDMFNLDAACQANSPQKFSA